MGELGEWVVRRKEMSTLSSASGRLNPLDVWDRGG